jgi:hypothetical protein
VARARHVDRLHEEERCHVFDHASGISRGELDVGDDRVAAIVWIELAEGAAGERFILAGVAKGSAVEGGRDLLLDDDLLDVGLNRRRQCQHHRHDGEGQSRGSGDAPELV